MMRFVFLLLLIPFFLSCQGSNSSVRGTIERGYKGASPQTKTWSMADSSQFQFIPSEIEFQNGSTQLGIVDTIFDSEEDFGLGSGSGGRWETSALVLRTRRNSEEASVISLLPHRVANLQSYVRFEGEITDLSPAPKSVDLSGTPSYSSDRILGGASVEFNSLIADINDVALGNQFSVAFWAKHSTHGAWRKFVFGKNKTSGNAHFNIQSNLGVLSVGVYGSNFTCNDGTSTQSLLSGWDHFVFTFDNSLKRLVIYLNGVEVSSRICGAMGDIAEPIDQLTSNIGPRFDGLLDEFSAWDTVLNAEDVKNLFDGQSQNFIEHSSDWTPQFDGLVGYWKMDGNWQDSSSNNHHGTRFGDGDGSFLFVSDAKVGFQAGSFDGVDDYITIPDHDLLEPSELTISSWVRARSFTNHGNIISKGGNSGYRFRTEINGAVGFYDRGNSNNLASSTRLRLNVWEHIVVRGNAQGLKIYINGKLDRSNLSPYGAPQNSDVLRIGTRIGSDEFFDGDIDDVAIWATSLTDAEINEIYQRQKQKYAASFESQVIDLGASGDWTELMPRTPLPFYKELASSDESGAHYSSAQEQLRDGLAAHWRFEEVARAAGNFNDLLDHSGNGNHGEYQGDNMNLGVPGRFNKAVELTGDSVLRVLQGGDFPITANSHFSLSFWINGGPQGDSKIFSESSGSGGGMIYAIGVNSADGRLRFLSRDNAGGSPLSRYNDTPILDYQWHHVVWVDNNGSIQVYIDGVLEPNTLDYPRPTPYTATMTAIGSDFGTNYAAISARLDEFAVWDRALTASEALELYRRGANRIKYQVRSCDDPLCEGENWMGPDGTPSSYYSELQNNSMIDAVTGAPTGSVQAGSLALDFLDYPLVARPIANTYFQYRMLMEAEENQACSGKTCVPELTSVTVGPRDRYYGGVVSITTQESMSFSELRNFQISAQGSCTKYQLSVDSGSSWRWWDGTAWREANETFEQSNQASDFTEENLAKLGNEGEFKFRAYFSNSGVFSEACSLESVSLTYIP